MDANMVALVLPSISDSFTASFQSLEWVISAYMITFASCLLPAGGFADRFGRRRILLTGLAIFCVSSVACGLAGTITALNIARAFQGVGAAFQLTSALAIIGNAFAQRPVAARAWEIWGTCMGLTICLSPLLGGFITQLIGWKAIFLINVPLGTLIAYSVIRWIPESKAAVRRPIDVMGSVTFPLALALLIWGLISVNGDGLFSFLTLAKFSVSLALFVLFILIQTTRQQPMVEFRLFRNPRFSAGVIGMFGYSASAQVLLSFFPLYLQTWFDLSPLMAGVSMLPFAVAMVIGPHAGNFIGRDRSAHWLLTVGLATVCAGNILTACLVTSSHYLWVALGMSLIGFGAGMLNGTTQRAIMGAAPPENTGMVSGIAQSTRFASIVLAVGVLGAALAQHAHAVFEVGPARSLGLNTAEAHQFLDQVLTGNGRSAGPSIDPSVHASALLAARLSSASGFSLALMIAALIAGTSAVLIWRLSRRPRADLLDRPGAGAEE
ncbi:MFS transporter [Pseudomonas sp. NPDC088368]|uniref:MFS transporter n=1 Tax=Pseudomonas sp. NPDC088368 TaxID=3364453 RepID=UPI00382A1C29